MKKLTLIIFTIISIFLIYLFIFTDYTPTTPIKYVATDIKHHFNDFKERQFHWNYGHMGLVNPDKFKEIVKGGIFYTEKYDKNKNTYFLLHGIADTPRKFRKLHKKLEKTDFFKNNQFFYIFYPTGDTFVNSANFALSCINEMIQKHKIEKFNLISYSLGGIVTRTLLSTSIKKHLKNPELYEKVTSKLKKQLFVAAPLRGLKTNYMPFKLGMKIFTVNFYKAYDRMTKDTNYYSNHYKEFKIDEFPKNIEYHCFYADEKANFGNFMNSIFIEGPDDGFASFTSAQLDFAKNHFLKGEDHNSIISSDRFIKFLLNNNNQLSMKN